ncbi:anti-sigma factor domain-containing protein [Nonomuraea sp. 3N208]|uniref:anti-sigma factor n=1 Tax=Nonomuraea sp. 3N208 TaxID=3457421 RepID=UPI003FD43461
MNDELHTLSGAYAVHALPYAEWVLFEEHLRACQGCGAEVRRLRETAARLSEMVAEPPPAMLRSRLLAAAHQSRREADAPTLGYPAPPSAPGEPPTLRILPEPARARGPAAPGAEYTPEVPARAEGGGGKVVPLRRKRSKVLAGLAAVSAAAAVAFGAVAFDARRDLGELTVRNDEMVAVLAAPDAKTLRQPVTSGGTATVVISRAEGRMMFASSDLSELPASREYELWLMGPDGPRPAGMLGRAEGGVTTPVFVTPLREDDKVALTVEPAGGSPKPTTQPIMLAELPEA